LGLEAYMRLREPFIALQQYLADPAGAASLQQPGQLSIPTNTPPQIAQQLWNQVLQQAVQNAANTGVEVPYSVISAVIESTRVASEFKTVGKLTAVRAASGEIQIAGVDTETKWKVVAAATPATPIVPHLGAPSAGAPGIVVPAGGAGPA
ncbi:MAG: hypothetical protein WB562_04715, partial [Candidatus Sulfotelmatobacter sp.]